MAVSKERKAELVKEFGKDVKNTGSTEVQIAILTDEINNLTEHLKEPTSFSDLKSFLQTNINSYIIELTGRKPIILPIILDIKRSNQQD